MPTPKTTRLIAVFVLYASAAAKPSNSRVPHASFSSQPVEDVPEQWDWRTKDGVIWPVVDQGQMGNSLAIVVADAVSSHHVIQGGNKVQLSAQEVFDCCIQINQTSRHAQVHHANQHQQRTPADQLYRDFDVYACIVHLKGLCWAADYPETIQPETCQANKCTPSATISGGYTAKDEMDLKNAVYKNPAVAFVDAGCPSFQMYTKGVYDDTDCDPTVLDHTVLIVGYTTMDGVVVWICKNSWGAEWGDQGYIYIARNKNIVGIASMASIPV